MKDFNMFTFDEPKKQSPRASFQELREMMQESSSGSCTPILAMEKKLLPLQDTHLEFHNHWRSSDLSPRQVQEFEFETAFGAWYLQSEEHTCLTSETSRTQRTFNPHSSEDRRHSQDYFKQRKLSNASNFLSDFASELGSFNEQEIHIIDACIESKEEDHSSYVAPPVINPHLENILRQLSQQHQCEFRSVDRIAQPMKCNRPSYQEFRALFEEAEQE
eukprot:TRINITY_DN24561_c0_g1_i1.p1 TRINITY_DN24561_c0_g1~~TRINITY_DN24561_c0_g1_i1.p1  ORF type:complete len:218 (-),score=31.62 TRINITY_DN24561_c0_g1_i1:60-713(-)